MEWDGTETTGIKTRRRHTPIAHTAGIKPCPIHAPPLKRRGFYLTRNSLHVILTKSMLPAPDCRLLSLSLLDKIGSPDGGHIGES